MIKNRFAVVTALAVLFATPFFLTSFIILSSASVSPSVIIYKTRADYSKHVPVTLSDDKSKVVSYPDPKDVYFNGQLAYPTALAKGYWLDNRGIGTNTAFIKLTYEEYSKLSTAPSTEELYALVIDKNPFTKMYNLGNRYSFKDAVAEINRIIEKCQLKHYKRIK